jgi:hypothetical protein
LTTGGDIDTRRAMTILAQSFPSKRLIDGVEPWDADRFLAWFCGLAPSHGMVLAGQFVLGVWNRRTDCATSRANSGSRARTSSRAISSRP